MRRPTPTRRRFLTVIPAAAGTASAASPASESGPCPPRKSEIVSLNGAWRFRLDRETGWHEVRVPHTWQIEPATAEYRGKAWYARTFDVPAQWRSSAVRVEFEAVFHSATVNVNGRPAGTHLRKGYTAFTLDITRFLHFGAKNEIIVEVDNSFDELMLPRGHSSDWAHDGGIYRPVQLLVTPQLYVEQADVDADLLPDGRAALQISIYARNTGTSAWRGAIGIQVRDQSGSVVLANANAATANLSPGETRRMTLPTARLCPRPSSGISTIRTCTN